MRQGLWMVAVALACWLALSKSMMTAAACGCTVDACGCTCNSTCNRTSG